MVQVRHFSIVGLIALLACGPVQERDPLPSWNDGPTKSSITDFVREVTTEGSDQFVSPAERIAVFDNDGTLWSEQPAYAQLSFAIDRVKVLAPEHPEWKSMQPFKAVLDGDLAGLAASGEKGLLELVMATHAGDSPEEFKKTVSEWLAVARHPRFDRPYTEMVYQPMLELLSYLRANNFKIYVVSGGGVDFMRAFAQETYGIAPEQVIGSRIKKGLEMRNGIPTVVRQPQIEFINDKAGKPVAIDTHVGRRPIAAFGNSDGDHQMLQWTAAGNGLRLMVLVHHTDGDREWAYDRNSPIGHLDKALDEANQKGWTVVDMQKDWNRIYPFEQ